MKLQARKPRIEPATRDQLGMAPLLDDPPAIHHHDPFRRAHGRQPVRDDQRGTIRHQPLQRLLDKLFALGVECAGRFVQQQDRRIAE